jgi:hypothetical protein
MKIFFLRLEKRVLSCLNSILEYLNYFVIDRIFNVNELLKTDNIGNPHAESKEIIEEARNHSKNPAFNEKESVFAYYFYLMKHYTAVYEAHFGIVPPVQIFNEHRMALDHIIRSKEEENGENMNKAINHALRGLLDILKLNCAGLKEKIIKEHKKYPSKAIGMVSNGDYIKRFIELQNKAEDCMYEAKRGDYNLTINNGEKTEVADKFMCAFDAHNEWLRVQRDNLSNIIISCTKYTVLRGWSLLIGIIVGIITGLVVNYLWSTYFMPHIINTETVIMTQDEA